MPLLLAILFLAIPARAENVCAKVSARGSSCANLKVQWDLSACADTGERTPDRVRCLGDEALAATDRGPVEFRARFVPVTPDADGEWKLLELTRTRVLSSRRPVEPAAPVTAPAAALPAPAPASPSIAVAPPPPPVAAPTPVPFAATPPLIKPLETAAQREMFLGFSLGVNLDTYYQYNFNEPAPLAVAEPVGVVPAGNTETRVYDAYHNQFSLNLAEIEIARGGKQVGFLIDLDFGLQADLNSRDEVGKHIGRAFVTYEPTWLKKVRVRAGKFHSHVGWEAVRSKDNWNYSRSTTFGFGSPFWHTGAGIETKITDDFGISGYVYNGTTTAFYENNGGKSLGLRVDYRPLDRVAIQYNFLTGAERPGSKDPRTTHELNVTYTGRGFSAVLEALTGLEKGAPQGDSRWHGAYLAARAGCLHSGFSISPRLEWFRDETGFATGRTKSYSLYSGTLTFAQEIAEGLSARFELRWDHANVSVFTKPNGHVTRDQATATIAVLFSL